MPLDTFVIRSKDVVTLDANSGTSVVTIGNFAPYIKAGYRVISEYFEVENTKAVSFIKNLPKVEFPVFDVEDSESKQLLTAINLEWKSPRIEMNIVMSVNDGINWHKIAAFSLLNSSPYPYREYSLGNHSIAGNTLLGVQIRNANFGLLKNGSAGSDKVTIFADVKRVITLERITDTSTKIANTITPTASIIANSNSARSGITFFNTTTTNIFIDTVSSVSIASHLAKLEPGDYWEPPTQSYTGNYYGVVASGSVGIEIREFV